MSGKFQLIRFFFEMCLEGSCSHSLTSEEVRQPHRTQKEVIVLWELNINENPNRGCIHLLLPPEHTFKLILYGRMSMGTLSGL